MLRVECFHAQRLDDRQGGAVGGHLGVQIVQTQVLVQQMGRDELEQVTVLADDHLRRHPPLDGICQVVDNNLRRF